jgi:hypothetical protein
VKHRSVAGTILYTSNKPERLGQARGIEHFRFTHHSDGKVTLRAYCEIEEPAPSVLRDVTYAIDEHGRPMDCYVRLSVDDRFMGSGWFRFGAAQVECESYGPGIGRLTQSLSLEPPIDGFGTHPVVADAYLLARLQWQPGVTRKLRVMLPSPDHRGATAPMLVTIHIDCVFLGRERVTVKAGTFDALHFRYSDDGSAGLTGRHPDYDIWVSDDADGLLLQAGVGGYMQTWYELISLERA